MKGFCSNLIVEMAKTNLVLGKEVDLEPILALAEESTSLQEEVAILQDELRCQIEGLEDEVAHLKNALENLLLILDEVEHEPLSNLQKKDVDKAYSLLE